MLQLLKSRMGMIQAWTVIIMVAAEQAAGERWNRGKNQAGGRQMSKGQQTGSQDGAARTAARAC